MNNNIDAFLDHYTFHSNNIEFRMMSAKSIEKFKNTQAFQLNELSNGKFHFSNKRRELLLLKYDIIFKCIIQAESMIIHNGGSIDDLLKNGIVAMMHKAQVVVHNVVEDNNEYFDEDFTKIWFMFYDGVFENVISRIGKIERTVDTCFFNEFVDIMLCVMDHSLIIIHELNQIMDHPLKHDYKEMIEPCLYISNLAISKFKRTGVSLINNRIDVYRRFYNIKKITIRNFTDQQIPYGVFDTIEKDIVVNYKKSF